MLKWNVIADRGMAVSAIIYLVIIKLRDKGVKWLLRKYCYRIISRPMIERQWILLFGFLPIKMMLQLLSLLLIYMSLKYAWYFIIQDMVLKLLFKICKQEYVVLKKLLLLTL